jgi:hypothetical protein
MLLGDHRKRKRSQMAGIPYDVLVLGHFHQLQLGFSNIVINGSVKGYDEYAYDKNLPFEPPRQAFWLTDAEHGMTLRAPVWCISSKEDWQQ